MPVDFTVKQDNFPPETAPRQRRLSKARPPSTLDVPKAIRKSVSHSRASKSYDNHHTTGVASDPESSLHRSSYYRNSPSHSPATPSSLSYYGTPLTSPAQPFGSPVQHFGSYAQPEPILFYHSHHPHYGFTNFSPHRVRYKGKDYPTSEHLFQSLKFEDHRPGLMEHIRTCSERPSVAFSEARRFQPEVRKDWMDVNIRMMDIALWHKFTQHQDLLEELLATGDAELIEDSDKDSFWGIGAERHGRNELGKALERLRTKLRDLSIAI